MEKILWFASSNKDKIKEVEEFLTPKGYVLKSLLDLPNKLEIAETGSSYEENALIKATILANIVNAPVIGDDTGLEIKSLDNFPGLYSQRWKGRMNFYQAMEVILGKMSSVNDRSAEMVTVLAYVDLKKEVKKTFIGRLGGQITKEIDGEPGGFGYDQIFYLPSKGETLYRMGRHEKNKISHRYQVLEQLVSYLDNEASK